MFKMISLIKTLKMLEEEVLGVDSGKVILSDYFPAGEGFDSPAKEYLIKLSKEAAGTIFEIDGSLDTETFKTLHEAGYSLTPTSSSVDGNEDMVYEKVIIHTSVGLLEFNNPSK